MRALSKGPEAGMGPTKTCKQARPHLEAEVQEHGQSRADGEVLHGWHG